MRLSKTILQKENAIFHKNKNVCNSAIRIFFFFFFEKEQIAWHDSYSVIKNHFISWKMVIKNERVNK